MIHVLPKMGIKKIVKGAVNGLKHLSMGMDLLKEKDPVFHEAPVVIFLTAPTDLEWNELDIGMSSQNIMLAAKSLGLDSCPVGFGKFMMETESYASFGVPSSEKVLVGIVLGYGKEAPAVPPRKKDNLMFLS